jgi:hypothetical protein
MKQTSYKLAMLVLLLAVGSIQSCKKTTPMPPAPSKPSQIFYGVSNNNMLMQYNTNKVETAISTNTITGLQTNETLMAIDFRPATGQLYGLGSTNRLYIVNTETGKATAVGATPFMANISGTAVAFDFNPTVDRIRLVTSTGINLRLNPETGGIAATDLNINPSAVQVSGAAYTNSVGGAATTTLFDIDFTTGKLFKQDPPNNGVLTEVGSLGVTGGINGGFDIAADNSIALATVDVNNKTTLQQINLESGKATNLGNFTNNLVAIAIPSEAIAYATDANNNLQIFNFNKLGAPTSKPISGLQSGENILAIDMRPATGQLYAVGSSSRLYTLNMATGAATAVSMAPFSTLLAGTSFGFDFNPTVDRIRVVSNTGQNLRLNPIDGTVAAVDMALNPSTFMVHAAAYTNNYAGATSTVLYDLDKATNALLKQLPPNDGLLTNVGMLGTNVGAEAGFDIGGKSNMAYGLFNNGSIATLYSVNINTGLATKLGDLPNNAHSIAIGLGF